MDILNWLYMKTAGLVKTTANNPDTDLIALGANVGFNKRDDQYQTYAMTVKDFSDSLKTYKVYTALLTQSGTDAPVVTVLENTLGEILVWSYSSNGTYGTTINDSLINNTYLSITNNMYDVDLVLQILSPGDGIIEIATFDNGALTDGVLSDTPIEIRVYN